MTRRKGRAWENGSSRDAEQGGNLQAQMFKKTDSVISVLTFIRSSQTQIQN